MAGGESGGSAKDVYVRWVSAMPVRQGHRPAALREEKVIPPKPLRISSGRKPATLSALLLSMLTSSALSIRNCKLTPILK